QTVTQVQPAGQLRGNDGAQRKRGDRSLEVGARPAHRLLERNHHRAEAVQQQGTRTGGYPDDCKDKNPPASFELRIVEIFHVSDSAWCMEKPTAFTAELGTAPPHI